MAGIYIHIPFCRQKCHYCNFFSIASTRHRADFVAALLRETEERYGYLQGGQVSTIYLGGGTPSLLHPAELEMIFEKLFSLFQITADAEITLEANPDDVSEDFLEALKSSPVNRLSMGVQSFFDDDLSYLHRNHKAGQALKAIEMARNKGFDRLTIDLIYGIPTLTDEKWKQNIATFMQLGISHLSAYALTVETKTALAHLIRKGQLSPVDEVQSTKHFEMLLESMEANGFVHYEISNFAKPGHYSRHNSLYWLGGHYLGLGPSAHSFNGISRQWNVSNLSAYIRHTDTGGYVEEKEILTVVQQFNEYVMTSLRTSWGCDLEHIANVFGPSYARYLEKEAATAVDAGRLRLEGSRFYLTKTGKLFADGIAAGLFLEEPL